MKDMTSFFFVVFDKSYSIYLIHYSYFYSIIFYVILDEMD